jgi:hypothetical protein
MLFGMLQIFPRLAYRCAVDPLAGLVDPPQEPADASRNTSHVVRMNSYALDEPADGE